MVRVKSLSSPDSSVPVPCWSGSTRDTSTVAPSATSESSRQTPKYAHLIRGRTDASHRGLRPCRKRERNHVTGIALARVRLR